jgi:hypothetical protein
MKISYFVGFDERFNILWILFFLLTCSACVQVCMNGHVHTVCIMRIHVVVIHNALTREISIGFDRDLIMVPFWIYMSALLKYT